MNNLKPTLSRVHYLLFLLLLLLLWRAQIFCMRLMFLFKLESIIKVRHFCAIVYHRIAGIIIVVIENFNVDLNTILFYKILVRKLSWLYKLLLECLLETMTKTRVRIYKYVE